MSHRRKILVVAPSIRLAAGLVTSLGKGHYELVVVSTFSAAMVYLGRRPDLIITEVKLGEYNGLHLALRGRALRHSRDRHRLGFASRARGHATGGHLSFRGGIETSMNWTLSSRRYLSKAQRGFAGLT